MANPGNVIGGHKANLNNPSMTSYPPLCFSVADQCPDTSEESKQHSKEVLEQASNSGEIDTSSSSTSGSSSSSGSTEGKNPNNMYVLTPLVVYGVLTLPQCRRPEGYHQQPEHLAGG